MADDISQDLDALLAGIDGFKKDLEKQSSSGKKVDDIDALLAGLDKKQSEWDQFTEIAPTLATAKRPVSVLSGVPTAQPKAVTTAPAPAASPKARSLAVPNLQQNKARSGSDATGISVRPLPAVAKTASKLEQMNAESRARAESMRRKFEATQRATNQNRWKRKGDITSTIYTPEQVKNLIDQGAAADDFEGADVVTSGAYAGRSGPATPAPAKASPASNGMSAEQLKMLQELDELALGAAASFDMDFARAQEEERRKKQRELDSIDTQLDAARKALEFSDSVAKPASSGWDTQTVSLPESRKISQAEQRLSEKVALVKKLESQVAAENSAPLPDAWAQFSGDASAEVKKQQDALAAARTEYERRGLDKQSREFDLKQQEAQAQKIADQRRAQEEADRKAEAARKAEETRKQLISDAQRKKQAELEAAQQRLKQFEEDSEKRKRAAAEAEQKRKFEDIERRRIAAEEAVRKQREAEAAAAAEQERRLEQQRLDAEQKRAREQAARLLREQAKQAEEDARAQKLRQEEEERQRIETAKKRREEAEAAQRESVRLRRASETARLLQQAEEERQKKAAQAPLPIPTPNTTVTDTTLDEMLTAGNPAAGNKKIPALPPQNLSQKMLALPSRGHLVRAGGLARPIGSIPIRALSIATASTAQTPQATAATAPATSTIPTIVAPTPAYGQAAHTAPPPRSTSPSPSSSQTAIPSPSTARRMPNTIIINKSDPSETSQPGVDDAWKMTKLSMRVAVPQLSRSFECRVDLNQTIASFKQYVWVDVLQAANIRLRGTTSDYIFRAEVDDMLVDEERFLYQTPYFKFCADHKVLPVINVVFRSELDAVNKQIEQIIGGPIAQSDEAKFFRGEMQRVMNLMMMTSYRRVRVTQRYLLGPLEEKTLPNAFNVHFFVPADQNPNQARDDRRPITVSLHTTAAQVIERILSDYPYLFIGKPESPSDYVLKLRSLEEYFFSDMELITVDFLRNCLRKRKPIDFIVIEKDTLNADLLQYVAHYEESRKSGRQNAIDLNVLLSSDAVLPVQRFSAADLSKPLRISVKSLEKIPFDTKLFNAPKKRNDPLYVYVSAQVMHLDAPLGPIARTNKQQYNEDDALPAISFDQPWLEVAHYSLIPKASMIHWEIRSLYKEKDTLIGWCRTRVFDCAGIVKSGPVATPLWIASQKDIASTTSAWIEEAPANAPKITCQAEDLGKPVVCLPFNYGEWKSANPSVKEELPPQRMVETLTSLVNRDPLAKALKEELELLWRYRAWAKSNPLAPARLMSAVPWAKPGSMKESYRLLQEWTAIEPLRAIDLLNKNFIDPEIRAFAVRCLHNLSDEELSDILLQLVQALKHEAYHDSALARFLITRAVFNQTQIGNFFFWHLKACQQLPLYKERFEVVLEVYLRHCSTFRENLRLQNVLFNKLKIVAVELKTVKDTKRQQWLTEKLQHLASTLPSSFQIPTNCSMVASGFRINKCKNLDSKTLPLWLVCENIDPLADPLSFIFKVGDDLRQDQLTLQMFKIMDKLWRQAGIDLKMSTYTVLDAGVETGMIEVVTQSATNAAIQKQYGGVKAAFSEKPLYEWLKKHNPNDADFKSAVRDFVRSCAGYCIATYILGIGDRHNDNIMCTKAGHMFHIDFGRFLGNAEKFAGVSRDRAPFVFTPEFAYVMGGVGSPDYKQFVELCCEGYNVLRKHASVFISLFAMMLSTGIPELRSEEDLNYLRDAFSLELTDEEATKKFEKLIELSIKTKATQLNFALHIMAHPE